MRDGVVFVRVPRHCSKPYHRIFILLVIDGPATYSFLPILPSITVLPRGCVMVLHAARIHINFAEVVLCICVFRKMQGEGG